MFRADNLTVRLDGQPILSGIDFTADDGVMHGIVGPNGSGKSTLVTALYRGFELMGSRSGVTGTLTLDGDNLQTMRRQDIAQRISVVPQLEPDHPGLRALDVVDLGRLAHRGGLGRTSSGRARDDEEICLHALAQVHLADCAQRTFTHLSGGERQRVVIARALAQGGDHLLFDEPTNHLDMRHQIELMDFVAGLRGTTVTVLHDLNLALRCCQTLTILSAGRVYAHGAADDVLTPQAVAEVWGVEVEEVNTSVGRRLVVLGPVV